MKRRDFCTRAAGMGMALGMGGLVGPTMSSADAQVNRPNSADVGDIYRLQADFHRAKTTQDIDLMMSLWAVDGTLNIQGDLNSPYVGADALAAFWLNSGSFTHRRFSLVPSFKTQIDVHGDQAWLYFECHDVGDFDLGTRFIASDTFLAGVVRKVWAARRGRQDGEERGNGGRWVFWNMTAGRAFPLSVDDYFFP
jgi:hypothetical protein